MVCDKYSKIQQNSNRAVGMIKQEFSQGKNKIRVETAESIEEMKNGQPQTYFFVNGKQVPSYQDLVKFIVTETQKNKETFIPENLADHRQKLIETSERQTREFLNRIQRETKANINPNDFLKGINDITTKTDITGVRIVE